MNIYDIKARFPELAEAHFKPANQETCHVVSCRVPPSRSRYELVDRPPQMRFDLYPTPMDDVCKVLFHGNPVSSNGRDFIGLSALFGTANHSLAQSAKNVIDDGGDSHHLTSIYLVAWGEHKAYLAGHAGDSSDIALVVEDYRYVVRIANIDLDCGEPNLTNQMMRALLRLPTLPRTETGYGAAFYMAPRSMRLFFNKQMDEYCRDQRQERIFNIFRGVAVRETDALHCHETRVI